MIVIVAFPGLACTGGEENRAAEPSVRQFSAWLDVFNSGDRERYAKFLADSFPARLALLMDLLDNQSRSKGIQVAASTHSPQVLRLIKEENLKYATLAYRLKGNTEGRLKPLTEIPHLLDVIKRKDIARLHESSWMENTMEFSEGTPKTFPIESEAGAQ